MQKTNNGNSLPSAGALPRKVGAIETVEQLECLLSLTRERILHVVQAEYAALTQGGSSGKGVGVSIREIADQLGRKPASLYRHIEALVGVGLILPVAVQPSGGRDALAYAPFARTIRLAVPQEEGPALDALADYLARAGSHAGKESALAIHDTETRRATAKSIHKGSKRPEALSMISMSGWLTPDQLQTLRDMSDRVNEIFEDARRRPGTRLTAVTMMMRPVVMPDGSTRSERA